MVPFIRAYPPQRPTGSVHVWYVFRGEDLVVEVNHGTQPLAGNPHGPNAITTSEQFVLGTQGNLSVYAAVVPADCELSEGLQTVHLRTLMNQPGVTPDVIMAASYAKQLVEFRTLTRFCTRCGAPYRSIPNNWGSRCDPCAFEMLKSLPMHVGLNAMRCRSHRHPRQYRGRFSISGSNGKQRQE